MEKWRKKGGDKYNNQEFRRIKSNNNNYCYRRRKPPLGVTSNCQGAVPYWEKRFVSSIGSLSWDHFLEAQKFTYLYDNIKEWDDAAGEEAFRIAKDRFYAKFHGHPCDVEQHNPDLYIDEIDWNAEVDHNLMLDFDSEPVVPDVDSNHEPVLDFGDVLPDPYKDYSPYGWGDSDDKIKNSWGTSNDMNRDQGVINWDDYINNGRINWDSCDGGANNDWWDWNANDNKAGDQGFNGYVNDNDYYPTYGNVHNERYMSSHKPGSFHGNNSQRSRSRINWDGCDTGGANNDWWDWNENDNKAGDQGCNGYVNDNDYYPILAMCIMRGTCQVINRVAFMGITVSAVVLGGITGVGERQLVKAMGVNMVIGHLFKPMEVNVLMCAPEPKIVECMMHREPCSVFFNGMCRYFLLVCDVE